MAPPLIDIIHRSFVLGLVGIGGYGLFMGWKVHEDTLRRGKELMERREMEQRQEIELADAAQAAIQSPLADSPLVSGNTPGGKSL